MPHLRSLAALACALPVVAGCVSAPRKSPTVVPVSTVINLVKEELRVVARNLPPLSRIASKGEECTGDDGVHIVKLTPEKVKVTLKTVAVREDNPSVGLIDPIGVISVDPSYSGAYFTGQSQTLALEFGFPEAGKASVALTKEQLDEHPLAQAIISTAKSMLDADHTPPCLKPGNVTATATFDVVNKSTTGVTLKLWIFKLGEKRTVTDEAHQIVELTYNLSKGSSNLLPP